MTYYAFLDAFHATQGIDGIAVALFDSTTNRGFEAIDELILAGIGMFFFPYVKKSLTSLKTRILDEFVAVSGVHRKHAIRLLRYASTETSNTADISPTRNRPRLYDEEISDVVIACWEASDRICGKRLKAALPQMVEAERGSWYDERRGATGHSAGLRTRGHAWTQT